MIFTKSMDVADKIQVVIYYLLRLLLVVAILEEILKQNWVLLFGTILILAATFIPFIIKKKFRISFPIEFELMAVLLIFGGIFLGSIREFYLKFWWFDGLLHAISGFILGFFGFVIIYSLYKQDKIDTSPLFIGLFSFCFAVALGAVWEIYEFAIDSWLGFNMQETGLVDTMWDLILDSSTALITAIIGALYIKGNEPPIFHRLVRKFVHKNPWLFEKERRFKRLKALSKKMRERRAKRKLDKIRKKE